MQLWPYPGTTLILMLNFWAWTAPEIIEGLFFVKPNENPGHVICTYCSANKDRAEGLLPASSRYLSERIAQVKGIASKANQRLCILSGEFGLLESDEPIPWYDHWLTLEEMPSLIEKVGAQLVEKKIKRVDYYTRSVEVDPYTVPYTSLMEAACHKSRCNLAKAHLGIALPLYKNSRTANILAIKISHAQVIII